MPSFRVAGPSPSPLGCQESKTALPAQRPFAFSVFNALALHARHKRAGQNTANASLMDLPCSRPPNTLPGPPCKAHENVNNRKK